MYSRVYIEITNLCNRCCSFCPGTTRPGMQLTPEDFRAIAQKLVGITEYLYYHLMGEPLTHPGLEEMLGIAKQLGFRSVLTTNGTLLPKAGDMLLRSGIYKVNISVHSFEEGTENDYVNYIRGCTDFAARAAQAGILVVLRLWNQGSDGGRNTSTEALLHEAFPQVWREGARGIRLVERVYLEYGERFDWPDLQARDQGQQVFCYGLRDHFGILCDGTVVPCCLDREGAIPLGNIFQQNLREILNSPRAKAMVQGFSHRNVPEELCRKCGYARRFG